MDVRRRKSKHREPVAKNNKSRLVKRPPRIQRDKKGNFIKVKGKRIGVVSNISGNKLNQIIINNLNVRKAISRKARGKPDKVEFITQKQLPLIMGTKIMSLQKEVDAIEFRKSTPQQIENGQNKLQLLENSLKFLLENGTDNKNLQKDIKLLLQNANDQKLLFQNALKIMASNLSKEQSSIVLEDLTKQDELKEKLDKKDKVILKSTQKDIFNNATDDIVKREVLNLIGMQKEARQDEVDIPFTDILKKAGLPQQVIEDAVDGKIGIEDILSLAVQRSKDIGFNKTLSLSTSTKAPPTSNTPQTLPPPPPLTPLPSSESSSDVQSDASSSSSSRDLLLDEIKKRKKRESDSEIQARRKEEERVLEIETDRRRAIDVKNDESRRAREELSKIQQKLHRLINSLNKDKGVLKRTDLTQATRNKKEKEIETTKENIEKTKKEISEKSKQLKEIESKRNTKGAVDTKEASSIEKTEPASPASRPVNPLDETSPSDDTPDIELSEEEEQLPSSENSPEPEDPNQQGTGKNDGLYDVEIENIMAPYRQLGFQGVISSDEMHLLKPRDNMSFIMNTSPKKVKIGHWIAVNINPESVEYYNSFGNGPNRGFLRDLKKLINKINPETYLKMKINNVVEQDARTNNCGFFAMKFLIDRYKGIPFKDCTKFSQIRKGEREIKSFKNKVMQNSQKGGMMPSAPAPIPDPNVPTLFIVPDDLGETVLPENLRPVRVLSEEDERDLDAVEKNTKSSGFGYI